MSLFKDIYNYLLDSTPTNLSLADRAVVCKPYYKGHFTKFMIN